MNLGIVFSAIFVPFSVTLLLSLIKSSQNNISDKVSNEKFTLYVPKIVLGIGICDVLMTIIVELCFTLFSEELPNVIFYIVFDLFMCLGLYLILKTVKWKVKVNNKTITVIPILSKPYSFQYNDIISAKRQTKKNQTNSERIVIKTKQNKKVIVESLEISYQRFLQRLKTEVDPEYLIGFNS